MTGGDVWHVIVCVLPVFIYGAVLVFADYQSGIYSEPKE